MKSFYERLYALYNRRSTHRWRSGILQFSYSWGWEFESHRLHVGVPHLEGVRAGLLLREHPQFFVPFGGFVPLGGCVPLVGMVPSHSAPVITTVTKRCSDESAQVRGDS